MKNSVLHEYIHFIHVVILEGRGKAICCEVAEGRGSGVGGYANGTPETVILTKFMSFFTQKWQFTSVCGLRPGNPT